MLADVRRLVSGGASSSRDPVIEASNRVQGPRSASRSYASSSGGSSSSSYAPSRRAKKGRPERFLPLIQVARAAPRVVKVKWKRAHKRRNTSGSRGENFIPWILDDADGPQDLEEEERMERTTRLFDCYAAHKRKRQVSSSGESDTTPVQSVESSESAGDEPTTDGSSGDREITIPGSPELGLTGGAESDGGRSIRIERG